MNHSSSSSSALLQALVTSANAAERRAAEQQWQALDAAQRIGLLLSLPENEEMLSKTVAPVLLRREILQLSTLPELQQIWDAVLQKRQPHVFRYCLAETVAALEWLDGGAASAAVTRLLGREHPQEVGN